MNIKNKVILCNFSEKHYFLAIVLTILQNEIFHRRYFDFSLEIHHILSSFWMVNGSSSLKDKHFLSVLRKFFIKLTQRNLIIIHSHTTKITVIKIFGFFYKKNQLFWPCSFHKLCSVRNCCE